MSKTSELYTERRLREVSPPDIDQPDSTFHKVLRLVRVMAEDASSTRLGRLINVHAVDRHASARGVAKDCALWRMSADGVIKDAVDRSETYIRQTV